MLELKALLSHALGGEVPQGFAEHLIKHRKNWDATFTQRLDDLAYEINPDLAVWEISVNRKGQFSERRLPLIELLIDS